MRTTALQYLYLQKPISTIILICAISVLPWIALGDFSTKGEPREAAVAVSMLESGDWILPKVYANEFSYKPPMAHWLMSIFSLPQGYVSEFTARLPSALACIVMLVFVLIFYGKHTRFQEAFIATLLLMTCIEIHRAGMTTRVDMILTAFIVIGLILLFRWEELYELKGIPISIPLVLSGATLTKGPVGILLPLFIFFIYLLLLRKYSFFKIIKSTTYIGIASLFIPSIWYLEAYRRGGSEFLNVILAENFGRFFHLGQENINYNLGHENGAWFNLVTLIAGFVPWTLLLFLSIFGLKLSKPVGGLKVWFQTNWNKLLSMEKIKLFSLVAAVCILFFYSIPSSKRSVYLMPAYPFIAIFIAKYMIYLAENRSKIMRVFAGILVSILSIAVLLLGFFCMGILHVEQLSPFISSSSLSTIQEFLSVLLSPTPLKIILLTVLLLSMGVIFYQMKKKINIKILYATIFLMFSVNLFLDGIIMPQIKNTGSARTFAEEITGKYPQMKNHVYVMNDLRNYYNLYGLNFYMKNSFRNFEVESPDKGFFLCSEKDFLKIQERFNEIYMFSNLCTSDKTISDVRSRIILSEFQKK